MAPGERLIWAERQLPRTGGARALMPAVFGFVVLGFGLFWTANAWQAAGALGILGLPFVAIGAALVSAPWWRPKRARSTIYAISDQRLLIIRGWPNRVVRSFGPDEIERLERREREDGSGDLIFRQEVAPHVHSHPHRPYARYHMRVHPIGFFGIPDVRRVEAAVRALQRGEIGARSR